MECLRDENRVLLDNVDFCNIKEIPLANFNVDFMIERFWRWLPIGDDFVDLFMSRDSDFCIVEREQAAVNEWIGKNSLFHIMRGIFLNKSIF